MRRQRICKGNNLAHSTPVASRVPFNPQITTDRSFCLISCTWFDAAQRVDRFPIGRDGRAGVAIPRREPSDNGRPRQLYLLRMAALTSQGECCVLFCKRTCTHFVNHRGYYKKS